MNALRSAVSGSCVRFVQDGFDLDLTYITPRLIAMGFPASGIEKTYRNSINAVSAFLSSRYYGNYRVYNLSERSYDYSKFEGRVMEFGFPDDHPPPLQLLLDIVNDMLQWISEGFNHVAVVHCVDGKGRTGLVCSCYLLLTGYYGFVFDLTKERELREIANSSIRDFWNARGQGVRFPSQALYIYYFVKVVWKLGRVPTQIPPLVSSKKIFIRSIVLNGVPDFDAAPRGGCTPFLQILPAPSQHQQSTQLLYYNSSWQRPRFETYKADPNGSLVFEVNAEVQGDVLVRCFHAKSVSMSGKNRVTMFHFTFNTDFFHNRSNVYRVPKAEVDEAAGNERFPDTFTILCDIQVRDDLLSVKENKVEQDRVTPTMQGWLLYKQDGFLKNWRRWWVVAHEGKLMYYHGVLDATPALEAVDLRGASVEICGSHDASKSSKRAHFFKVFLPSAGQRTLVFGAEAEQHLLNWIRAIGVHSVYGIVDKIKTETNSLPSFDKDVSSSPVASTILAELPSKMLAVELPGTYIYSADELREVARLKKFLARHVVEALPQPMTV